MYKQASDLQQRRSRQLWLRDLAPNVDWDSLPPEELRANLVAAKKSIVLRIEALPKRCKERAELGRLQSEIDAEIHNLRPKFKARS